MGEHKASRPARSREMVAYRIWGDHAFRCHHIDARRTRRPFLPGWRPSFGEGPGRRMVHELPPRNSIDCSWHIWPGRLEMGREFGGPVFNVFIDMYGHSSAFFDDARVSVPLALDDFDIEAARGYAAGSLGRMGTFYGASAFDQWNERREAAVACLDGHELFSVNNVAVSVSVHPLAQDHHLIWSSPQSASSTDVEVSGVDYIESISWQSSSDAAVDRDAQSFFWCGTLLGLGLAALATAGYEIIKG
jgi:hypothetical protein